MQQCIAAEHLVKAVMARIYEILHIELSIALLFTYIKGKLENVQLYDTSVH
jgi:hypothetical protein